MTTTHREVERKFRVTPDFALPDLVGVGGIVRVSPQPALDMSATYHDTADLTLIRWRTTLRRRTGGHDDGWHLKLPVGGPHGEIRDEVRVPLEASPPDQVPAALADIVAPLVRDAALNPMATVSVRRFPMLLLDASGTALLEVVDDHVRIRDAAGDDAATYREFEVEILEHDDRAAEAMLEAVGEALVAAGATPSSLSKATEALGALAAQPPDVPEVDLADDGGLAVDALRAALSQHVRRLLLADVGVRRDLPDSVHQMRVAARRLRSVLRTFEPLLDRTWAEELREELRWLADELGAIRDTEVLMGHLDEHAGELGEPDATTARELIDARLTARLATARSGALAALRSDRHTWLLEDLVTAVREPRVLDTAFQPTLDVLPDLVGDSVRRFTKAARHLTLDSPADEWHRVRIKAKRARYAVDALVPVGTRRLAEFADVMSETTELLGSHQDAQIAQESLRDMASTAPGSAAFTLGRLHAVEHEHQMHSRRTFLQMWPQIRHAARRSGMV